MMQVKKKPDYILYGLLALLLLIFIIGITKSYEYGKFKGMQEICKDKSIGINELEEFVCYDPNEYNQDNIYVNPEIIEGMEVFTDGT